MPEGRVFAHRDNFRKYFMDSNKNSLYEPEKRLRQVINELDVTIVYFLKKAGFVLNELLEGLEDPQQIAMHEILKTMELADIAFDYVSRAENTLSDIMIIARQG